MKTYHGKRTKRGCEVTVDGKPLRMQSNLSGNATTAFDWGYVGTGQLSMALLADLLGNDAKAKAMCEAFENAVVANLPHDSWTMTEYALATALAPLVGVDGARAGDDRADATADAAFGDMPVKTSDLLPMALKAEDAAGAASMVSEGGPVVGSGDIQKAPDGGAVSDGGHVVNKSLGEAVNTADAALTLAKDAHQADHADDAPADEAMSTANRAADHKAYKDIRAAGEAVALARTSMDDAKRVVAKPLPKIGQERSFKANSETKGD